MGEYATYNGAEIKIGTCEDMYYLRATQASQVHPLRGSLDPSRADSQKVIRFRFPWPDEDDCAPGAFDPYGRSVAIHGDGIQFPEGLAHHAVQFTAQAGYVTSIPCPEGPSTHGLKIHRNGFAGRIHLVQQAYRGGNLVPICRCGGCGALYNVPTWTDAEPLVVACRAEADRRPESREFWHAIADRIAAGFGK